MVSEEGYYGHGSTSVTYTVRVQTVPRGQGRRDNLNNLNNLEFPPDWQKMTLAKSVPSCIAWVRSLMEAWWSKYCKLSSTHAVGMLLPLLLQQIMKAKRIIFVK